jgi:NAD(P)-dependent dehydrogenase (short-subunit alcohol dehydrogenase family)
MDIEGKGVLITGASEGLGAALARTLAGRGAKVVLFARREAPLQALAEALRAAGGQAWAVSGDIADKEAIHALAATAAELTGGVELLVHNASTLGPTPLRLLLDTDCEDLERVLQVNLVGPFRLTKVVAGAMALRGRGLVLQVSSDAAVEAYPRWGAYGLSKAALDHLGRTFAAELEGTGVRFVSVDPGEMDTAMHAAAMPEADRAALARPEQVAEQLASLIAQAERIPSGARVQASSALRLDGEGGR